MLHFSTGFPSSPSSPTSPAPSHQDHHVDLTQRYMRGSSLEPIHQPVRPIQEHVTKKSTSQKIREKLEVAFNYMIEYFGTLHFDPSKELAQIPPHSAFFIIDHSNSFRKFCFKLVKSQPFRTITYAIIILSSLVLMLELPNGLDGLGDNPSQAKAGFCAFQSIIIWLDIGLLGFFIFEMILKMISLGVIVHRDSYLRGFFNIMDFLVTILTLIPIIYYLVRIDQREKEICISYGYDTSAVPKGIGVLRVLRVLRPIRAIRIKGLYLVVTGLISSFKSMLTIFFLDALIVIIFGVIGVQFFRGSFYFCTDPTIQTEEECIGYFFKYDYPSDLNSSVPGLACPIAERRIWTQHGLNFDNIGNATLTLFTMLTAEGWQNVMYSGVNSRHPLDSRTPLASILEKNRGAAVYFILYMIVMTFILLQLLVGFIIVTFQEVGVKTFRETKLDRNQRSCLHFALTKTPRLQWAPKYKCQERVGRKVLPYINSLPVKVLIMLVLLLNTVVLCLQTFGSDGIWIYDINVACTVFFALEALIKLVLLTPPIYFRDFWNTFGFLIVLGSVIEFIMQQSGIHFIDSSEQLRYSHLVSTLRVLRLVEFIPQVRRILWTVIRSLEIFPWVGYFLIIIIYMCAVIGMHVFGTVARATVDESEVRGIHQYNNFATFYNALFLMIRVITGENWQDVMLNCVAGQPCDNSTGIVDADDTCGDNFAYVFFPAFYLLSTIMILNLFVAIIMDNFEYIVWDRSRLGAYDLGAFVKQWARFDRHGRGKLKPERVFDLLRKIDPPVGWGKLCPRATAYKKMMRLNIPIRHEKETVDGVEREVKMVTFNASLFALVRSTLEIDCRGCPDCKKKCNVDLRSKLITLFPNMPQSRFDEVLAKVSDETVADEYAALFVQAEWRSFMLRRRRIVDLFKGSERKLMVHREIQDPGPDLIKERPLSTFNHDLDIPIASMRRKTSAESSRSSGDRSRLGSRSPRSPLGPVSPMLSPMPLLEPTGCSFLMLGQQSPLSHQSPTHEQLRAKFSIRSSSPDEATPTPGMVQPVKLSASGGNIALSEPPTGGGAASGGVASHNGSPLAAQRDEEEGEDTDSPFGARRSERSEGDDLSFASAAQSLESLDHQVMETMM